MLCPYRFNSYICTCLRKASIVPLWILIQSYLYGIERNIKLPLTVRRQPVDLNVLQRTNFYYRRFEPDGSRSPGLGRGFFVS